MVLNPMASVHHEKCDGSGYDKRVRADTADAAAWILTATEIYVGLTAERELIVSSDSYRERSVGSMRLPGAVVGEMAFTL